MYLLVILISISLAKAASTGSFCSSVSARSCQASGTAFCSSYLSVPAKTTTITKTATITKSTTATAVSGTVTKSIVQTLTQSTTAKTTATSTITSITTTTSTSTVYETETKATFENFYPFPGGCTYGGDDAQHQKRATGTPTKPACLSAYASGSALSSACKCLSIPTSTSTVTATTTKTATAVRTTVVPTTLSKTIKTTAFKTVSTGTTRVTKTTTSTVTEVVEETDLVVVVQPIYVVPQWFNLQDQHYNSDNNLGQVVAGGLQFSGGDGAQTFSLAPNSNNTANCTLVSDQNQQAYIDGSDGNKIKWGSPSTVVGYVQCLINEYNAQVICRNPKSTVYNAGWVDANEYWHIPLDTSNATANVAVYPADEEFAD